MNTNYIQMRDREREREIVKFDNQNKSGIY